MSAGTEPTVDRQLEGSAMHFDLNDIQDAVRCTNCHNKRYRMRFSFCFHFLAGLMRSCYVIVFTVLTDQRRISSLITIIIERRAANVSRQSINYNTVVC